MHKGASVGERLMYELRGHRLHSYIVGYLVAHLCLACGWARETKQRLGKLQDLKEQKPVSI
jgi:hypothetical protein